MLRCFVLFKSYTLVRLVDSFSVGNNTRKFPGVIKVEARITVAENGKPGDSSLPVNGIMPSPRNTYHRQTPGHEHHDLLLSKEKKKLKQYELYSKLISFL
jgi:hypothetical protein